MKVLATIVKEFLLLIRDQAGMAFIFLMPMVMVMVMALVQDAPFRDYQEAKLEVLFVNADHDSLGKKIQNAFLATPNIHLLNSEDSLSAKKMVGSGEYKAAIIIPAGASVSLRKKTSQLIGQIVANLGLHPGPIDSLVTPAINLRILFDPAIKINYKQALSTMLERVVANVQTEWTLVELQNQLGQNHSDQQKKKIDFTQFLTVNQQYASKRNKDVEIMSSVQHNVPAWAMFAMFLILFPLAGNFIKEREEGSMLRLRLISGSEFPAIVGKFLFYFCVCLFQFATMILVGIYVMPFLNLTPLVLGNNLPGTILAACSVAMAATGYGLLIAVYFKTPQQALSFGSFSVIILAALGGIWVPVYVMSETLQNISRLSPLNWGLESFTNLFLRGASTMTILPDLLKLMGFAMATLIASVLIHKSRTIS